MERPEAVRKYSTAAEMTQRHAGARRGSGLHVLKGGQRDEDTEAGA
jgi:hypothetical protein